MKLSVKTSVGNYNIVIEKGLLNAVSKYLDLNRRVLIITDNGVPQEYVNTVSKQCRDCFVYTIEQGEMSKNIDNFQKILLFMIEKDFTRTDVVIAVGGGVVGDLGGFISSVYKRGIDFYNIPTTLLAQIDSSIGGKTAIDLGNVKNIVGTFYPPKAVMIDTLVLRTLANRQLHSGLVEAIKMGASCDKELFNIIKDSNDLNDDLEEIIYKSLLIKKRIVENDELETGERRVLNYGHTIGHAIESYSNMSLLHGECVGIGMLYFSSEDIKKELIKVLKKYNLPISVNYDKEDIYSYLLHDKKATGKLINVVFVEKIGNYKIKKIEIELLKNYL